MRKLNLAGIRQGYSYVTVCALLQKHRRVEQHTGPRECFSGLQNAYPPFHPTTLGNLRRAHLGRRSGKKLDLLLRLPQPVIHGTEYVPR